MLPSSHGLQMKLFDIKTLNEVVNISTIPHRSPFRYPGGKTWLVPRIREWLFGIEKPALFIEPFAGGAIVGLSVAFENLASQVLLVEKDEEVSAVWKTILSEDAEWLANQILSFDLSHDSVKKELEASDSSTKQVAFKTILKNRIYHGGILAPGSGLMKNGENGKGLLSRWYPATLAGRIRNIFKIKSRIKFIQGDGIAVIRSFLDNKSATFFIDPPYTASRNNPGKRLYTHHELNHEDLFKVSSDIVGHFLMTYDNDPEIVRLSEKHRFVFQSITMKNTHHSKKSELLISNDLAWIH